MVSANKSESDETIVSITPSILVKIISSAITIASAIAAGTNYHDLRSMSLARISDSLFTYYKSLFNLA